MTAAAAQGYPAEWDEVDDDGFTRWEREKERRRKQFVRRRRALVRELGGECVQCGTDEDLHFDHPNGRTWEPRRTNQLQRMRRYEADHEAGNLQLLCGSCNGYDGANKKRFYAAIKAHRKAPRRSGGE